MFEQAISAMASVVVDPYLLGLIFATTILGVIIGVLPGLGATTGAALLLPFTLTMDPVHAIAVLATIYVSATFAGSITAILINTPGTSAAAATTFDGYPLAQKGEAGRALGNSGDIKYSWWYFFCYNFMFCSTTISKGCL